MPEVHRIRHWVKDKYKGCQQGIGVCCACVLRVYAELGLFLHFKFASLFFFAREHHCYLHSALRGELYLRQPEV